MAEKTKKYKQFKTLIDIDDPNCSFKSLPLENYEHYFISTDGRVWNKNTKCLLKQSISNCGYCQVCLHSKNKAEKSKPIVHNVGRLVALTFLPNPENLSDVGHINSIRTDNRLENLTWLSHRDNCNDEHIKTLHSKRMKELWSNPEWASQQLSKIKEGIKRKQQALII